MDDMNYNIEPTRDPDVYRTGQTRPPKRYRGLVAILLILVIFLCGIASAMGFLNLELFQELTQQQAQEGDSAQLGFSQVQPQIADTPEPYAEDAPAPTGFLDISSSDLGRENVPQEGGLSLQAIYTKAIDSVASIICSAPQGGSSGTGVVLSADGYLATNAHVVDGAQEITVQFTDGRQMPAQIIGTDQVSDLAVLKVEAQDLIPAEFGDSAAIRVGDLAVAIGDPLGVELRGTMTDGIISAINRDITTGGRTMTLLQTNAALNSGNSGGPLLNCYGQVIGINTMKIGDYMNSAGVEGLGFAIPSTTVKEIVDQLIVQGYVSGRPELGIVGEDISLLYQRLYNLPQGVYISQVSTDSSAYSQGIRPGDVLVEFDGERIYSTEDLQTKLYSYQAEDQVDVVIYRKGEAYTVPIILSQAQA